MAAVAGALSAVELPLASATAVIISLNSEFYSMKLLILEQQREISRLRECIGAWRRMADAVEADAAAA